MIDEEGREREGDAEYEKGEYPKDLDGKVSFEGFERIMEKFLNMGGLLK